MVEQIDCAALTFLLSFECDHFASVAVAAAADIVVAELASEAVEIAAVSGSASVDTDLELVEHFDTMVEP